MPINEILYRGVDTKMDWDLMKSRREAMQNIRQETELMDYPENKAWLRTQRGMLQEEHSANMGKDAREADLFPIKQQILRMENMVKARDLASDALTNSSPEDYEDIRRKINKAAGDPGFLPSLSQLEQKAISEVNFDGKSFKKWFDNYKTTAYKGLDTLMKEQEIETRLTSAKIHLAELLKPKAYEPKMFTDPAGDVKWRQPGQDIPSGERPYEKPTKGFAPQLFQGPEGKKWVEPGTEIQPGYEPYEKPAQPKDYQPQLFVDRNGKPVWVRPGEQPAFGAMPYKAQAPDRPGDFERKWAISQKIATETLGREPTSDEIAKVFKQNFGVGGLLSLFGLSGGAVEPPSIPGKEAPRQLPKFR